MMNLAGCMHQLPNPTAILKIAKGKMELKKLKNMCNLAEEYGAIWLKNVVQYG